MMPTPPPPPQRQPAQEERVVMKGPSEDLSADKVRAIIQKKRTESGVVPTERLESVSITPSGPLFDSDEVDPEKVKAMLRQTRACAIRNAQSAETLKEAQASTPGRGVRTGKFKTKCAPTKASLEDGVCQDKKERRTS